MALKNWKTALLLGAATLVSAPNFALAQDTDTEGDAPLTDDIIIVTGTSTGRTSFNSPQSVNAFPEEDVRKFTASSQADVLTQLPGISAEGGGGEVATNFFVRGLPSGGQFQFTPLEYDGIPAFTTFGLNSSAFDVYYRNDLGIERLEYVTGGVSNLFGPGSVAGIINYISKTGGPEEEGTAQLEWAEGGRFRGDLYASGPVGGPNSNTFYAVSGFYRYDEGPLDSGLPTEGFQLRGNLKREFEDGSGSFTLYGQVISDEVQFFLPLPLDGTTRERVAGNDGETVFTVNTAEAGQLRFNTPDGVFESPIDEGVSTDGVSIAAVFDKDLGNGWGVNVKAKYADYDHQFNLFLDGDGVINLPETQADFLANRSFGDVADASFTFTETGAALPDDYLLFGNRTLDRVRDATDFSGELNITKETNWGGASHNFTLGAYVARAEALDFNVITTYLADFRNEPGLVDVSVTDVDGSLTGTIGSTFNVTQNGVLNANGVTGDRERSALRYAAYLADQIEGDRWAVDVGVRVERFEGEILQRTTASTQVSDDPLLNDAIENISFPTGAFQQDDVTETEWAASISLLYNLTDNINLFGNFSRGFFFPQLNGQGFDADNPGVLPPYNSEIILTAEAGLKLNTDRFDGYITGFWTTLDDRQSTDFVNDGMGGVTENTVTQSTRAIGVEIGGVYSVTDYLSLNANVTFRDHEFTEFESDPSLVGNELRRQPDLIFNTGLTYDDGVIDFSVFHNHHGSNFANDGNTVELDSYNLVRLDAGYTHEMSNGDAVRLSVNVFNLFDSEGLAEGSPRLGNFQSGNTEFFVGRPILPRRITVRATYDF